MKPVQSLQHLLSQISRSVPTIPRLVESGTFDEPTLEAVMIFQRDFHIPVTGVVDQATWDAIIRAYYEHLKKLGVPPDLPVFPFSASAFPEASKSAQILIAQAMFTALTDLITNFASARVNGVNSDDTLQNIKNIQELSGLSGSGTLDRATWSMLAHLYAALITRSALAGIGISP